MVLHATSFQNQTVHGLLLGKSKAGAVDVQEAVPVSHGAPTKPMVEIALGLVEAKSDLQVVGWYTAPSLLEDTRAGPVALRMATTLAVNSIEPILIVVQNQGLSNILKDKGGTKVEEAIQAYGKDFGGQYLEAVTTYVEASSKASAAVRAAFEKGVKVADLVQHFEEDASQAWFPNPEIDKLL